MLWRVFREMGTRLAPRWGHTTTLTTLEEFLVRILKMLAAAPYAAEKCENAQKHLHREENRFLHT